MPDIPILTPTHYWQCPSCRVQHVTHELRPHTPMHNCPRQQLLSVPYVPVADPAKELDPRAVRHLPVERGDYIGAERGVVLDAGGQAVMAVRTERADGSNDVHVFAAVASATAR